jgi:predicted Zn-dependent protease
MSRSRLVSYPARSDELQAVIAHEVGHVKNLDMRLMTLLAALVGAVALVGDFMGRAMRVVVACTSDRQAAGTSRRWREEGGNPCSSSCSSSGF